MKEIRLANISVGIVAGMLGHDFPQNDIEVIGTSGRRSSRFSFGSRLATKLVATINDIFSFFFMFSPFFPLRMRARIKKLISQKLMGVPET